MEIQSVCDPCLGKDLAENFPLRSLFSFDLTEIHFCFFFFCFRFLAIWWPLKCQITKRRARFIIVVIWVIACTTTIPWALFFDLVVIFSDAPDVLLCLEVWPESLNGSLYFLVANLVFCYILPLILISLCYILIWIKVWTRTIPTDTKDDQMERMQQKSKVRKLMERKPESIIFLPPWFFFRNSRVFI